MKINKEFLNMIYNKEKRYSYFFDMGDIRQRELKQGVYKIKNKYFFVKLVGENEKFSNIAYHAADNKEYETLKWMLNQDWHNNKETRFCYYRWEEVSFHKLEK